VRILKELQARFVYNKVNIPEVRIPKDLKEPHSGRPLLATHGKTVSMKLKYYTISVSFVK
jgi:hypothetical protein